MVDFGARQDVDGSVLVGISTAREPKGDKRILSEIDQPGSRSLMLELRKDFNFGASRW